MQPNLGPGHGGPHHGGPHHGGPPDDGSFYGPPSGDPGSSGSGRPGKAAIGIVLLSLLGSVVIGGGITGLIMVLSADMREQTHRFLDAVREGRDEDAYALTTRRFQQRVAADGLAAYLDQNARGVRRSQSDWINGFSGGGGESCMEVWLYGGDTGGERGTVYVILEKEDGAWRVSEVTHRELPLCESD